MTMGNRISEYRKKLGLTQDALAQKLNVSNQAVSKWESDQCCPDIQLLPRLADEFAITVDELLSEVRQQGYRDIREIEYAILEENGKFSLLPRMDSEPPTRADTGTSITEIGCAFPLVSDGVIDRDVLLRIGRDEAWLREVCRREGVTPEELFLMTVDDSGEVSLTKKEEKK